MSRRFTPVSFVTPCVSTARFCNTPLNKDKTKGTCTNIANLPVFRHGHESSGMAWKSCELARRILRQIISICELRSVRCPT